MKKTIIERLQHLHDAPLNYSPENELGVVYLFSHLAKKWRLKVDKIRSGFPDCIAYQKTANGKEKQIRIEFEFKSSNFKQHKHDSSKCDWIVCWEHNWPNVPSNIVVIELRCLYGLGFNVWSQTVSGIYKERILKENKWTGWSVSPNAHKGDLILFYKTKPEACYDDVFILEDRPSFIRADWKDGMDYMSPIKRICKLKSPIFYDDLKNNKILCTAGFVRAQLQGRKNVTEYWPYLFNIILKRNPDLSKLLSKYKPENIK